MERFLELVVDYLPGILALFFCLPVHEFAHGYVAYKLGDPTPKYDGRLTLNPFVHLDLWGSVCLVFAGFGWAKPVMVNPFNLRDRKGGMALVAIAGPIANLVMMLIFALLARIVWMFAGASAWFILIVQILLSIAYINLCLAVFNLLPVPPLDGSKVLYYFLPNRIAYQIQSHEQTIYIVFMAILVLGNTGILAFSIGDILGYIIDPIWYGVVVLFGF